MNDDTPHLLVSGTPYPSCAVPADYAHAVQLRCSGIVQLHLMVEHGTAHATRRVIQRAMPGASARPALLLIDLARLVPGLEGDLRGAPLRDHYGLAFYGLRMRYPTLHDFWAACDRTKIGTWWYTAGGYRWCPASREVPAHAAAVVTGAAA